MYFVQRMKKLWPHLAALLIFLIAATYITFPLLFRMGSIVTSLGDELLIAWIMNWDIHAIATDPINIFQTNIFFPYHNTLAFSETFITSSLFVYPALKIIGQPIAAVNFTLISSLALLGFCTFLLVKKLSGNFLISLLTGFLVMFSPATLDKNVHLQVLSIHWLPLSMYFFIFFLETKKSHFFAYTAICFIGQIYNSFMPAYFIIVANLLLFFLYKRKKHESFRKGITESVLVVIVTVLLLSFFVIKPYLDVSKEFSFARDIREAVHLGLQPEDLLYPNDLTRLQPVLLLLHPRSNYPKDAEFKVGYVGLIFTLLSIFCIFSLFRKEKGKNFWFSAFVLIALSGLVLSLGPVLHWGRKTIHTPLVVPLPYALFYYILPGFKGFRGAYRWEMLFIICMAVASGLYLHTLTKLWGKIKQYLFIGLLCVAVIAEFHFPMHFVKIRQVEESPKVHKWLNTTPIGTKVIFLPIYNWYVPGSLTELHRMYYSTQHFRSMVNGGSGFSPPPWQNQTNWIMAKFPSDESVAYLKNLGIKYIIVNKSEYDALARIGYSVKNKQFPSGEVIISRLKKMSGIKKIHAIDKEDVVITLY